MTRPNKNQQGIFVNVVRGLCACHGAVAAHGLGLLMLFMFTGMATAQVNEDQASSRSRNLECQELMCFGLMEMTPYAYIQEDGEFGGYLYEIAEGFLEHSGMRYQLRLRPLVRMVKEMTNGVVGCVFLADDPSSRKFMTFVEPAGVSIKAGVISSIRHHVETYDDLYGLSIGVPAGVTFYPKFDDDIRLSKVRVPSFDRGIEMLVRDRVDALIGNIDGFYYYAKQNGIPTADLFSDPLVFMELDISMGCNRVNTPKLDAIIQLQRALRDFRASDEYHQILGAYGVRSALTQ